jgi:hypothetical protein
LQLQQECNDIYKPLITLLHELYKSLLHPVLRVFREGDAAAFKILRVLPRFRWRSFSSSDVLFNDAVITLSGRVLQKRGCNDDGGVG